MILKNKYLFFFYLLLVIICFFKINNKSINSADYSIYIKDKNFIDAFISVNPELVFGGEECDIDIDKSKYLCEVNNIEEYKYKIIFIGDSHARHLYNGLKENSDKENFGSAIFQLPNDCNIVNTYPNKKICDPIIEELVTFITKKNINKIAFSYKWSNYDGEIDYEGIENKILSFLKNFKNNKKILFFLDNIELNHHNAEICLSENIFYKFLKIERCFKSFYKADANYEFYEKVNKLVIKNTSKITNTYINPNDYICKNLCKLKIDGNWIFSDRHHFSNFGSRYIMDNSLDKILSFIKN